MVTKVISELKSISRLKIFRETEPRLNLLSKSTKRCKRLTGNPCGDVNQAKKPNCNTYDCKDGDNCNNGGIKCTAVYMCMDMKITWTV